MSSPMITACAHLREAEQFLLTPTPSAIEQAGFVLQKAQSILQSWDNSACAVTSEDFQELQACCARVKKLLEGSLRFQWTYIHRISSATQTYTPTPGTRTWTAPTPTVSLQA